MPRALRVDAAVRGLDARRRRVPPDASDGRQHDHGARRRGGGRAAGGGAGVHARRSRRDRRSRRGGGERHHDGVLRRHRALGVEPRRSGWARASDRAGAAAAAAAAAGASAATVSTVRGRAKGRDDCLARLPVGADVCELLQSAIDSEGGTLASHCVSWFSQVTLGWMKTEYVRLTGASSFAPPPGVDDSTLVIDICLKTCGDVGVGRCSAPPGPPSPPKCVSELEPCNSGWCASPDGQGGTDCYAGPYGEQCSCSQGAARPVGTLPFAGQTYTQYTCCTEDSGVPTQGSSCAYPGVSASPLPPSPPCVFSPPAPPALPLCGTRGNVWHGLGANLDSRATLTSRRTPHGAPMCGVECMSAEISQWMRDQRRWAPTRRRRGSARRARARDGCAHDCSSALDRGRAMMLYRATRCTNSARARQPAGGGRELRLLRDARAVGRSPPAPTDAPLPSAARRERLARSSAPTG